MNNNIKKLDKSAIRQLAFDLYQELEFRQSQQLREDISSGKVVTGFRPPTRAEIKRRFFAESPSSQSLIAAFNDALAGFFAWPSSALAAASENSSQRRALMDDGKEVGAAFSSQEHDETTVYVQLNEDAYLNQILYFKVSNEQHILALLTQRSEEEIEGVASKFTFKVAGEVENPLENILNAEDLDKMFTEGNISEQEIHNSITATDNPGKRAWLRFAKLPAVGDSLKEVILSHPDLKE